MYDYDISGNKMYNQWNNIHTAHKLLSKISLTA
jgi:hypothetical protein